MTKLRCSTTGRSCTVAAPSGTGGDQRVDRPGGWQRRAPTACLSRRGLARCRPRTTASWLAAGRAPARCVARVCRSNPGMRTGVIDDNLPE